MRECHILITMSWKLWSCDKRWLGNKLSKTAKRHLKSPKDQGLRVEYNLDVQVE